MPDDAEKLKEFRETNIRLAKENQDLIAERDALKTKYDGVDPDAVKAERAELAELKKAPKTDARIVELEAELATEKTAREAAQKKADAFVFDSAVSDAFTKAGGRSEARSFMVSQAREGLEVKDGKIVGKAFDPDNPGTKLTLERFIALQVKASSFAFLPSAGGGANPSRGGGGAPGAKELRNPTPAQLGDPATAAAIKRGDLKVVNN